MELTMLSTSTPNTASVGSTAPGYTNVLNSTAGLANRWLSFRYDADYTTDLTNLFGYASNISTGSPTGSTGRGYNDSPFALAVPQGTGAQARIGRDISVVSDQWYFRWTFPAIIPGDTTQGTLTPGTLAHQRFLPLCSIGSLTSGNRDKEFDDGLPIVNHNLTQRPCRLRMVCIFEKECDSPGEFGFRTAELFESQYDIHSRFKVDQASGYKILYDKTKTFTLMDSLGARGTGYVDPTTQDDKSSAGPYEARFKVRLPSYLRRYEGRTSPDETSGDEVLKDVTTGRVDGGIARGAITWYFFFEDVYCPTHTNATSPGTITTQLRQQTPEVINLEVDRKTFWIDP